MADQIKIIKGSQNEDAQKEISLAQGSSLNIDGQVYVVNKIVKDEAGDFSVYIAANSSESPKDQDTGDATNQGVKTSPKISAAQKANVRV